MLQDTLTRGEQTSCVTVAVTEDDATVQVTVTDDGTGFQTDAASEGFGLIGVRERVALLGGELHFDSQPGAGTAVAARIPVVRRPSERSARSREPQPHRRSA